MILRTGIDLSSISALERRATRSQNDFIARFWTEEERAECAGDFRRLAARWSAKEATIKALGAGIGKIDPIDIEVVIAHGAPSLKLHASAATRAVLLGLRGWSVSLTHEGDVAAAVVVAFGEV